MRLGVLVPRYGREVVGGAEYLVRMLCEQLVSLRGWKVEVFTTGAVSAATWADELSPGAAELNGVTVHRHRSRSGRDPAYLELLPLLADDPWHVPEDLARHFVELVGPVCPDAVDHAVASSCDLVAVTPYPFWPAVEAVPRLGRRAVFHPAAHDEPELHLPLMGDVFHAAGGFAYLSRAERTLVERTFGVGHRPQQVVGAAVEVGEGDTGPARAALGLEPDEPFVLCLGRVERNKGSHALAELWRLYRSRRPDAPRLVVMGPVHEPLEPDGAVLVTGQQPEDVKWGALRACTFLVNPSAWESFSLVVPEAWLAGAPVLVNGRCHATVELCRLGRGGLWFSDYADFEVLVDRLLGDESLRSVLARRGLDYARTELTWEAVTARYGALVERIGGPQASEPAA